MGAYSPTCRHWCFFGLLAASVSLAASRTKCTADDTCHFGGCEQKRAVLDYIQHNGDTVDCKHPYVHAALSYIDRQSETYLEGLIAICGNGVQLQRPFCETRIAKSRLDTLLLIVFSTVGIFKVAQDLSAPWAGD